MEHDRYYIDGPPEGEEYILSLEESHHLTRVRRAGPGAAVTLFDGEGGEYLAEVLDHHKGRAKVRIMKRRAVDRELPFLLSLAVAPVKPRAMDDIIRRATEIGIHSLRPVYCTNSVVHYEDFAKKREKWRRTTIEACKQCGRNLLPLINAPATIARVMEESRDSLLLLAHDSPDARPVGDISPLHDKPRDIICFIGPEGGFTDEEAHMAASRRAHIVSLGRTRLRAGTAAIALLASVISHRK